MHEKDRKRTRVPGQFDGVLQCGDHKLTITTSNLSLKGLLAEVAETGHNLQPGDSCTVVLPLAAEATVTIESTVARLEGGSVAVDFTGMDPKSYAHLRNMVRYAAEDPDAIDGEQAIPAFDE